MLCMICLWYWAFMLYNTMSLKRKENDAGRASFPLLQRWGAVGSISNQGQRKDCCGHSQVLIS